jgi:hypothetical protein
MSKNRNRTRTNKNRSWTDEQLIQAVKTSTSVRQCVLAVGLKEAGENTANVKLHIKRLNLDTSHFLGKGQKGSTHNHLKRCTIEEMMVENGQRRDTATIKKHLIDKGIFPYECLICKLSTWQNLPISLHIDHINGTPSDNRIEKLRLLCPNCHSQTDTYCGKGKSKDKPKQNCIECNAIKTFNSYDLCEDCRLQHLKNGDYASKHKAESFFDDKTDDYLITEVVKAGSFSAFEAIANLSRTAIKLHLKKRGLLEKISEELGKIRSPLSGKPHAKK